jgi:hypothetical protein
LGLADPTTGLRRVAKRRPPFGLREHDTPGTAGTPATGALGAVWFFQLFNKNPTIPILGLEHRRVIAV